MATRHSFRSSRGIYLGIAVLLALEPPGAVPFMASSDPITVCTERLKTIHRALIAYERENHQWPDHLSALVPKYLPGPEALHDPADRGRGDMGSDEAHADPKYEVSYSYERCSDVSNGLAQPLGPFPKPDVPNTSWGSWRLVNGRMESFFGDQVPLVRCYHHRVTKEEREPGHDTVLNLTPSGGVYRSDYDWRHHTDSLAFLLRTLERDLSQAPGWALRSWLLWRVDEFLGDQTELSVERHGPQMVAIADLLFRQHRDLIGEERTSCRLAARFFCKTGHFDQALSALDVAGRFPGAPWQPIVEKQLRAEIYHAAGRWNDEIATYQALLEQRPEVRSYMESLAQAYIAAGKPELARTWRDKAEPGRLLVGQAAPQFQVRLLESGTILTLESALRGQKAVLLDFWFCDCPPCRLSYPHLEQLYKKLGPKGLAMVAVNFRDSDQKIAEFRREQRATIPLAAGQKDGKDNPIFEAYKVSSFPTSFLIDATGKVVWRGLGYGAKFKIELRAALQNVGFELTDP